MHVTYHDPIWFSKHGRLNGILLKKYFVTFISIEIRLGKSCVIFPAIESSNVPGVTMGFGWIFTWWKSIGRFGSEPVKEIKY